VDEENNPEEGEEDRRRKRRVRQHRRKVEAADDCGVGDGSPSRGAAPQDRLRNISKKRAEGRKKRRQSSSAKKALERHDPLGLEWVAVRDVPAVEVNRLGEPVGLFWDHMKPYLFDRAAYVFPWHADWNKQSEELKARFILRLKKLYPGPWEAKAVLKQVGTNLREKRNRLKKRFKVYSNPKAVNRPKGCTLESWQEIYQALCDPKKKAKSDLCKAKAQERVARGSSAFTHRTGRAGYRGIVTKFVSSFFIFISSSFSGFFSGSHRYNCMGLMSSGNESVVSKWCVR
jgi:hypothetical protein